MRTFAAIPGSILLMGSLSSVVLGAEADAGARIEIRPREASAIGVLNILSNLRDRSTVVLANPGKDVELNSEAREPGLNAYRAELMKALDLKEQAIGGIDVVVPSGCVRPFQLPGEVSQERLSVYFTNVESGAVMRIAADVAGLEASFPGGLPRGAIGISFRNGTVTQLLGALGFATGAELKVSGKRLEISRGKLPRNCHAAQEPWLSPDADMPAVEPAEPWNIVSGNPIRGYIAFTPRSPLNAIVVDEQGAYLAAARGDPLNNKYFEHKFTVIDREVVEIQQVKADKEDPRPVYYLQFDINTGERIDGPSRDKGASGKREWLERYALEDLLLESTRLVNGTWQATIRDAHGFRHTVKPGHYLGPNDGRIVDIDASAMDIIQIAPTELGGYREVPIHLGVNVPYEHPRDRLRREIGVKIVRTPVQRRFVDAARTGDVGALDGLLKQGAVVDAADDDAGANALAFGAVNRQFAVVKWLLEHGATTNLLVTKDEDTPLTAAILGGSEEVVALLVQSGANPNIPNLKGNTPLHEAARKGTVPMVRLLLDHEGDAGHRNEIGLTAPIRAALDGNLEVVKLFLDRGVDINAEGESGETMASAALYHNNLELMRFLLDNGANVEAVYNYEKKYPGALERADAALVRLIEEARGRQQQHAGK